MYWLWNEFIRCSVRKEAALDEREKEREREEEEQQPARIRENSIYLFCPLTLTHATALPEAARSRRQWLGVYVRGSELREMR